MIDQSERSKLQELVKQLREHGPGGGSGALSAAMQAFGAYTPHDLALTLALRLLGESSIQSGLEPVVTVGGQGGAGYCNGAHQWTLAENKRYEYCPGCGIARGRPAG